MTGPNIFDPDKLVDIRHHGNEWAVVSRDPRTDEQRITIHETIEEAYYTRRDSGGEVVDLVELEAELLDEVANAKDIWENGVA